MHPKHNCIKCGKPLNADGNHPAELYAGTYTGLCYGCEKSSSYVVKEYRDGAKRISYPPHCPSWRRDREEFIAYDGCPFCKGTGRFMKYSHGTFGSYPVHCDRCFDRYYNEPLRKWAETRKKKIYSAAQNVYDNLLKKNKIYKLVQRGKAPDDKVEELRKQVIKRHERIVAKFKEVEKRRGVYE